MMFSKQRLLVYLCAAVLLLSGCATQSVRASLHQRQQSALGSQQTKTSHTLRAGEVAEMSVMDSSSEAEHDDAHAAEISHTRRQSQQMATDDFIVTYWTCFPLEPATWKDNTTYVAGVREDLRKTYANYLTVSRGWLVRSVQQLGYAG